MASPGLAKFEGGSDLSFGDVAQENSSRITKGRVTRHSTTLRPTDTLFTWNRLFEPRNFKQLGVENLSVAM